MKKRMLIFGIAGLMLLGTVIAVGASKSHSGWCHSHDGGQRKMNRIAEKLDLNETQKTKLQGVHESLQEARQAMSEARAQTFEEVLDLIASDMLDQTRVQAIVKRHQAIVEDFTPRVTAKIADFHAVLSPEQKSKATEFLQQWKDRFEERRGFRS